MRTKLLFYFFLFTVGVAFGQADTKGRIRAIRDLSKGGSESVAGIAPYLRDPDLSVRIEATKALVEIGGPKTLEPLIQASQDNDPEIQIRATDGLVNVYLPGYSKTGMSGTLQRAGNAIKGKFGDNNDQIIDAFIQVRPEAITALGRIARGGSSLDSRANAARAIGILRGGAAIPDLVEALHSKNDQVMYEGLIAIQKIRDPASAPSIAFLMRDLDEKIQIAALETTGILRNREAAPDVRSAMQHARTPKVKRTALASLAMIGDPGDRAAFLAALNDKDDAMRAAAAEGLGRLANPADRGVIDKAFVDERKMNPRLSDAFALVALGNLDTGEFSPLKYLVNTLNVRSYRGVAGAFLTELARDPRVRQGIYPMLARAPKDEKIQMSIVLARSGDRDSVPYLEQLSKDPDSDVAAEGIRSLRTLRARLP